MMKEPDAKAAAETAAGTDENIAAEEGGKDAAAAETGEETQTEKDVDTASAECAAAETRKEEHDDWKDRYTRQLAEFDNFRKRTDKEKSQMYDLGAKSVAEKLLPTIDNFERGLQNAPDDAFAEGMKMVYKQLLKNLEETGVNAIDCVGREFDPNYHNAVLHEEDDSERQNIVIEELQKGYMYKETLLRPAMVKVLN